MDDGSPKSRVRLFKQARFFQHDTVYCVVIYLYIKIPLYIFDEFCIKKKSWNLAHLKFLHTNHCMKYTAQCYCNYFPSSLCIVLVVAVLPVVVGISHHNQHPNITGAVILATDGTASLRTKPHW